MREVLVQLGRAISCHCGREMVDHEKAVRFLAESVSSANNGGEFEKEC